MSIGAQLDLVGRRRRPGDRRRDARVRVHGEGARERVPDAAVHGVAAAAPAAAGLDRRPRRDGGAGGGPPLRVRAGGHRLARARGRSRGAAVRQLGAEQPPRRADGRGRGSGQARLLREAARTDGGGELRPLAARRGSGREAHDGVQLPLRARGAAGAADDRGRRARRDPPLPRPLPAGLGDDHGRRVALPPRGGGLGRARRSRRARDRPGALPGRRDLVGVGVGCDLHAGPRGRRRLRGRGRVRGRRRRHHRGEPVRRRAQERPHLGDQRIEPARSPSTSSG